MAGAEVGIRHLDEGAAPLSVQPFDVSHGDKAERKRGKHLATRFVRQVQRIQRIILSADPSSLGKADQVRIESQL
jgi:hypothetical protein